MNQKVVAKDFSGNFYSKRKIQKEKFNFEVNYIYIALWSIIIILLLYYIWTLNVNATRGYNIIQLESEKQNLLMEKERLYMQIAELSSLSEIMNKEDLKNMEKVDNPNHLVIKNNVQYVFNNK